MKIKIFLFFLGLAFIGCKKKNINNDSYYKGELTILTDESFKSVTEALAESYMINYPEAKISVKVVKEDLALMNFLQNKAKAMVMSRNLNARELEEYKTRIDSKFVPANFAVDAVVFVVPSDSELDSISIKDIEVGLQNPEKPFIFDGANASNLNFVAQKIGKKPADLKFSVISGNENLVEQLGKYPGKIGVIGLNAISRPYDKLSEELRTKIKILKVIDTNGLSYDPSISNLKEMTYPFTRTLYFLTNESGFNIASGFVRFSCTHIGQKVVQKEGLQPYNLYKREVQMR